LHLKVSVALVTLWSEAPTHCLSPHDFVMKKAACTLNRRFVSGRQANLQAGISSEWE